MAFIRKHSYLFIFVFISFFIIGASYFRGLYFDQDFYWLEVLTSIIFLIFVFVNYQEVKELFKQPYIWVLSLIPLLYFIQAFFAENQFLAFQQFFRWIMALEFFILVLFIKNRAWIQNSIWMAIVITGIWTSIFGWLAVYQLVNFPDAFLTNRIASVFQYPNTFAAIITAVLMGILIRSADKSRLYPLLSLGTYLLFITLIFTYSRGAWLVFALIWIIALFFLSFRQQILYIIHSGLIGAATLLTLSPLSESITNKAYGTGFKYLLIASLLSGLIYVLSYLLISRLANGRAEIKIIRLLIPVLTIFTLIAGYTALVTPQLIDKLPEALQKRLADINLETLSVAERSLFVTDATKMIKESPLFGEGGGAWKQQYERYQSFPYTSRQAHNFYYQLAVEIGIVGLIIFIGFLLLILIAIIQARKELAEGDKNRLITMGIMVITLLLHSYIDFNMSYGYFQILLFILLGLLTFSLKWKFAKQHMLKNISLTLIILLALINIIYAGKFMSAHNLYKSIVNMTFQEAEQTFNRLINLNPYNMSYRFEKINLYQRAYYQTNDEIYRNKIIEEADKINGQNLLSSEMLLKLANSYAGVGNVHKAYELVEKGIKLNPWQIQLYEQQSVYAFNLAGYYKQQNQQVKYQEMVNQIYWLNDEIKQRREYLDQQIPALRYGSFTFTIPIRLQTGKLYATEANYQQAVNTLAPLTKHTDPNIKREAIAWSIYAYTKLNNMDKVNELLKQGQGLGVEEALAQIYQVWE